MRREPSETSEQPRKGISGSVSRKLTEEERARAKRSAHIRYLVKIDGMTPEEAEELYDAFN